MQTILITGSTGNVGIEVIKNLSQINNDLKILAGTKEKNHNFFPRQNNIEPIYFNFEDEQSVREALNLSDILFLLRPPQLADVKKHFQPLIKIAVEEKISHIVFLSVQGAQTSSLIPHHKIEKLILESGINYTFLRPAYFMQNFTTTLRKDLIEKNRIFLPAGNAKFNLIDVEDLGAVAATIMKNLEKHINKAYDLTNQEQLNFYEMAEILSQELNRKIDFVNPNLLSFFLEKRREKLATPLILVMIMLHYLPRFNSTPATSDWVEKIIGKKAKTFHEFVQTNNKLI